MSKMQSSLLASYFSTSLAMIGFAPLSPCHEKPNWFSSLRNKLCLLLHYCPFAHWSSRDMTLLHIQYVVSYYSFILYSTCHTAFLLSLKFPSIDSGFSLAPILKYLASIVITRGIVTYKGSRRLLRS